MYNKVQKKVKQEVSKEQKDKQVQFELNTQRLRLKLKSRLFPFLVKETDNIEDAKQMCSVMTSGLQQLYMNRLKETTVKDLKMEDFISTADAEVHRKFLGLLEILGEETMADALRIIEDLPKAIEGAIRIENSKRKLEDLKIDLL